MSPSEAGAPLPPLPEPVANDELSGLDGPGLDAATERLAECERATVAAMSPYDRQLRELRARRAELETERRRRERAEHVTDRRRVREQAASGGMPTLADALAGAITFETTRPLRAIRAYLGSGGEVGFGFATRAGVLAFTDGRSTRQTSTWGEAVDAYSQGWEPGAPGVRGVRVHLAGTRIERVVAATDVVLAGPDG